MRILGNFLKKIVSSVSTAWWSNLKNNSDSKFLRGKTDKNMFILFI
jgi:hypothetical protein